MLVEVYSIIQQYNVFHHSRKYPRGRKKPILTSDWRAQRRTQLTSAEVNYLLKWFTDCVTQQYQFSAADLIFHLYLSCLVSKDWKMNGNRFIFFEDCCVFSLMLKESPIYTALQPHIGWKASWGPGLSAILRTGILSITLITQ